VLMCVRDELPHVLDEALQSICGQSLQEFELLLIDDGSVQSGTIEVEQRWAARDNRIRLLREPARGLTASLNVGLRLCRAPVVARHDSDDWSDPQRLERQLAELQRRPELGLLGSQYLAHRQNGAPLWRSKLPEAHTDIVATFAARNPFCHGATLFRRDLALVLGGYRESLACSQDYDFFWRLSERAQTANMPDVLYHYRFSGRSISAQKAVDQASAAVITRALADMRRRGAEDFAAAEVLAAEATRELDRHGLVIRKRADNLLLAGEGRRALDLYLSLALARPFSLVAHAALLRGLAFVALPSAGRLLFDR
jgi:glycosyltransferase involved in cell wall biosynthesis